VYRATCTVDTRGTWNDMGEQHECVVVTAGRIARQCIIHHQYQHRSTTCARTHACALKRLQ